MASWMPLETSIVAVALFAGPHNWSELRYFLSRTPIRFGRARRFFVVAFGGMAALTSVYILLPVLYHSKLWSGSNWFALLGGWNIALVVWVAALVCLRGWEKRRRYGVWILPPVLAFGSINWFDPSLFSLAIVYLHPLMALWFFDRHLRRTRREWLSTYRRCLFAVPLLIAAMVWQLANASPIEVDNGLAWRITQNAGAGLLTSVSSYLLVSVHIFLETLHYGVWLVALPVIGARGPVWDLRSIPFFSHPHGVPEVVTAVLGAGLLLVIILWIAFAVDYPAARDAYFTLAIAHVVAEVPFLLRMV
jgi:hypothetical protein